MNTLQALCDKLKAGLAPVTVSPEHLQAEIDLMLQSLLGLEAKARWTHPDAPVSPQGWQRVEAVLRARVERRIPLQYLLGEAHFYGLKLHVSPAVLIPRPETEHLVETALHLCQSHGYQRVLDLGTGSGAIALALAHHLDVAITATDVSPQALSVAQHNAQALGLPIALRLGDAFAPVAGECFDLIVSNPPYVGEGEKPSLAPEVLNHEPHLALFPSGGDALSFYRRIAAEALAHLSPTGAVLVEIGCTQGPDVKALFEAAKFTTVTVQPDYTGRDRLVLACRG